MQQVEFDSFRYGLATLLVRRPNLRPYASKARWWTDIVEEYGAAVRCRDWLRAQGSDSDDDNLGYYENVCSELEDELASYLSTNPAGPYQS
jgi:hypothetical protein